MQGLLTEVTVPFFLMSHISRGQVDVVLQFLMDRDMYHYNIFDQQTYHRWGQKMRGPALT